MDNDIVQKLVEELNVKLMEIRKIYDTLETIKKITGVSFNIPDLKNLFLNDAQDPHSIKLETTIRPDTFFGQSNTVAAEGYLKMVGHAVSLDELYDALKRGGISFKGDGRKSLYTQLIRATRKFVKIGAGNNITFGLLEFYPHKRKASSEKLENVGGEVEEIDNQKGGEQAVDNAE